MRIFLSYVILISASASVLSVHNLEENFLAEPVIHRLPNTVTPTFYAISLTIDPAKSNFTGNENIIFDVTNESEVNVIYIHIDNDYIVLQSITLNYNINCDADTPNEFDILTVNCSKGATGSNNVLYIEYAAKFSTDGYGLFKSTYIDKGKEQIIIESIFEPIYARRAFPCFDELELRANFSIDLYHPSSYTAISNSPAFEQVDASDDFLITRFDVTPKISTYLVSILISKLHATEIKSDNGYEFKVFTRNDTAKLTNNVVGKYYSKILERLSNFTGIPYENLRETETYQVALPDYSETIEGFGGFGVFEYRETDLLDDGDKTTHRATQDIVTNMAYKLAHEWYGGDTTAKWWSDIWTNEAIATYIAYNIVDEVNEEFDIKNQFIFEVVRKSMQYDAYSFSQPLSSNESIIEDLRNISNKLDKFSFDKGAGILRMIGYLVDDGDSMKSTLAHHWVKRNETNTNGMDLLMDLTENRNTDSDTEDIDLYSYLIPWVYSPGYPLLTVKVEDVTSTGVEAIKLYQKRFVYPTNDKNTNEAQWVIPINNANKKDDFKMNVELYYLPDEEYYFFSIINNNYFMFNIQSGFFYRVNYDEILWKKLIESLNDEKVMTEIDPLSRAQLVDDILNIARTGDVSYMLAFQLTNFLTHEVEYYSWYTAFDGFSYILGKLEDDIGERNLENYILGLMTNVLEESNKKAAANNETHIDVLKRVMVLKWACQLGHNETVNKIVEDFKAYKEDQSSLDDYNLREIIYCNGIRYSENVTKDWDFLWNVYTTSLSVHEQKDILNALGCVDNEDILHSYLLKILNDDSGIKKQDALTVFKSIFSSTSGLPAAMSFLKSNLSEVISLGPNIWQEILYTVAEQLFTDNHLRWFNDILANEIFDDHLDVKSKASTLASVNNYWVNTFRVYVKEIILNPDITTSSTASTSENTVTTSSGTTTVVSTQTDKASSNSETPPAETTTDVSTTTDAANVQRIFSKMTVPLLILLVLSLTYC